MSGDVQVIQADREAAARVFDARARKASHPGVITVERHYAKVIRAAEGDNYDAVQAAAISRLATEASAHERGRAEGVEAAAARLEEVIAKLGTETSTAIMMANVFREQATAIRSLSQKEKG